jgi:hypothetical protein
MFDYVHSHVQQGCRAQYQIPREKRPGQTVLMLRNHNQCGVEQSAEALQRDSAMG